MGLYLIIIFAVIGIIVSAINAAAKKKARQERAQRYSEGHSAPPPPPSYTAMSDIQKAFMMMTDEEPSVKAPMSSVYTSQSYGAMSDSMSGSLSDSMSSSLSEDYSSYSDAAHEGRESHEGSSSEVFPSGSMPASNPYADIDLDSYKTTSEPDSKPVYSDKPAVKRSANPLKLFADKDEFTRAVIYSEILNRK